MKHDVFGFEVVVNYLFLQVIEIVQGTKDLLYDQLRLFLRDVGVLLHVFGQLWTRTVLELKHDTVFALVDFNYVLKFGNVGVRQSFLYFHFPFDMPEELLFVFEADSVIKDYLFNGNKFVIFHIIALVDFSKSSRTQQLKSLIPAVDYWPFCSTILGFIFLLDQFQSFLVLTDLSFFVLQLFSEFLELLNIKEDYFRLELEGALQADGLS